MLKIEKMNAHRAPNRARRVCALLLLAASLLSLSVPAAAFDDVQSTDWFAPAVEYVVEQELFAAVSADRFAPYGAMTRAMFYTVLRRRSGVVVDDSISTNLTDIKAGQWYTGSVVWAISSGIAVCETASTFGASTPITRAEICLAFSRFDRLYGSNQLPQARTVTFPDLGGLDAETCYAIASCRAGGVVAGNTDGRFRPKSGATRAEVALMFQTFCLLSDPASEVFFEMPLAVQRGDITGWVGNVAMDFPLSSLNTVTAEDVIWLNTRILNENTPKRIAPQGDTVDGNLKHVTNYGSSGNTDCFNIVTSFENKKSNVAAGVALNGRQEYYGYSLQTLGISKQDKWHALAQSGGKDPWQCTWWAWGRAAQYLEVRYGLDLAAVCNGKTALGNGRSYYSALKPYFLSDTTASANSIISWTCGTYGHVAYVEAVDDYGIWVSSADAGHAWRGITYIVKTDSKTNPYPLNWFAPEQCNGFNHLDFTPNGKPIGN